MQRSWVVPAMKIVVIAYSVVMKSEGYTISCTVELGWKGDGGTGGFSGF